MTASIPNISYQGRALIADDELSNRVILKALLKKIGYDVAQAENGEEAVRLYQEEPFDLVMMDVMMPVMDGYDATIRIKELSKDRFVPVIFLTAMTDEEALTRCIEVGGDDFLTKPYSHGVLASKVQSMQRIRSLHQNISSLYTRMQRDEEIAEQVFSNAVVAGNVALDQIRTLLRPASVFSGDLLLTAFSPSQDLHVLLGDFTGHGLAAALGALPTSEVFRSMTAKGFSPQQILQAINSKLHNLLPTGMFLAAQFVKVSASLEHLTIFNCGMPDIFLLEGKTREIKHVIPAKSLPLGITTDISFKDDVTHIHTELGDRVLLASDGVTEARNDQGEYFGSERFRQAIQRSAGCDYVLDLVATKLSDFCQEAPQDDDISLAEIPLIPELLPAWDTDHIIRDRTIKHQDRIPERESDSVEFQIVLRGSQLRNSDPVPLLINYLQETAGLHAHRRHLFTILTELFVNSLDHGVLGLKSKLKEGEDGFARYFELREQRLEELDDGFIQIGLRIHPTQQGGYIFISIEDSGDGFDFEERNRADDVNILLSGRGISLVESLSESIRYFEPGNKAEVIYRWSNA
jgi:CheY-like chemotaxis protein